VFAKILFALSQLKSVLAKQPLSDIILTPRQGNAMRSYGVVVIQTEITSNPLDNVGELVESDERMVNKEKYRYMDIRLIT
jgi:hypothetical protein